MAESTTTRKLKIVRLDAVHAIFNPTFSFPHEYIEYPLTTPAELAARIAGADIILTTRVPLTASDIETWVSADPVAGNSPKLITAHAIGTDMLDLAACRKFGVEVCNVPAASNESVAEHAIALYFAARRKIGRMHRCAVETDLWKEMGTAKNLFGPLPGTAKSEVVGIIGAGELGNRVAAICRALGMTVHLSDRKSSTTVREGRTPFDQILRQSTVLFITCPLSAETLNLITTTELRSMRKDSVLICAARGGIIDEEDLVAALKADVIEGAATDVFVEEPAHVGNSALIRALREDGNLNLVLTPHLAWYARSSIERLQDVTVQNCEAFVRGQVINSVF